MKELPILFSAPMVRALLADRKHVTRRIDKQWLKVKSGDRLWVRETLGTLADQTWIYSADCNPVMVSQNDQTAMIVWAHHKQLAYCPSIHMPRCASRITMEVHEDARLERLWDITEEEAKAEGIQVLPLQSEDDPSAWWQVEPGEHQARTARASFRSLWSTLHAKPGERWEDNPEVVRVGSFRRLMA